MDGHFVAAPEIHQIGEKYYLGPPGTITTTSSRTSRGGTTCDQSDAAARGGSPDRALQAAGPELDFCLGPGIWDIIDGTLYQEDGTTYMVFVHEWTQIIDGTMDTCRSRRTSRAGPRSRRPSSAPSEAAWAKEMNSIGEATFGLKMPGWVTDGPQLFRTRTAGWECCGSSWGDRGMPRASPTPPPEASGAWVQEKEASWATTPGTASCPDVRRDAALHCPPRRSKDRASPDLAGPTTRGTSCGSRQTRS